MWQNNNDRFLSLTQGSYNQDFEEDCQTFQITLRKSTSHLTKENKKIANQILKKSGILSQLYANVSDLEGYQSMKNGSDPFL